MAEIYNPRAYVVAGSNWKPYYNMEDSNMEDSKVRETRLYLVPETFTPTANGATDELFG
jgi:hypothetical protein